MPRSCTVALAALTLVAACAASPSATEHERASSSVTPSSTMPTATSSSTEAPKQSPASGALAWSQLESSGPAAREDHTWTVDPADGIAYLFGGRDGSTIYADTWAFDLGSDTWTPLAPVSSPPARFGHEAVWVDGVGVVIFAGQAGTTFFGDMWAFDPAAESWTQLPSSGDAPVPRYGSCAAVGPDGRLWISHGFTQDGNRFADTRAYDFDSGVWTDETPAGQAPVERCLHGCWWTDDGELTLYAGQTTGITSLDDRWTLADGAWSPVEGALPEARNLYARARLDGATLVFGGQALDASYLADLWLLADDEADATQLESVVGSSPAGRAGSELVRDAERGRVLLFGGRDADGALSDLWELSGV
jgi:Galactose oxidase, central domain